MCAVWWGWGVSQSSFPEIVVPPAIEQAMDEGAGLGFSISGGKDSQALANVLAALGRQWEWSDRIFAIHSHLGRAEWPQTMAHCQKIAADNGLELVVVRRPQGDLVDEMKQRMVTLAGTGKPFWPSASTRYCTADQKRGPIDVALRRAPFWPSAANRYCTSHQKQNQIDKNFRRFEIVISAEGLRAQESPARRKKPELAIRPSITAAALKNLSVEDALAKRKPGQRVAINWYPLHGWSLEDVWQACGTSGAELAHRQQLYQAGRVEEALAGWPCHIAYVLGNQRLSCVFCVLGSVNDLRNGARHNPELLKEYIQMEQDGRATFKHGWSLESLLGES